MDCSGVIGLTGDIQGLPFLVLRRLPWLCSRSVSNQSHSNSVEPSWHRDGSGRAELGGGVGRDSWKLEGRRAGWLAQGVGELGSNSGLAVSLVLHPNMHLCCGFSSHPGNCVGSSIGPQAYLLQCSLELGCQRETLISVGKCCLDFCILRESAER